MAGTSEKNLQTKIHENTFSKRVNHSQCHGQCVHSTLVKHTVHQGANKRNY